jgi:ribosomal-protein-alanine N-acetyltransferase
MGAVSVKAEALATRLGGLSLPAGMTPARETALARLSAMGLPGKRDEYWHYTNPSAFNAAKAMPAAVGDNGAALFAGLDAVKLVFVDGVFCGEVNLNNVVRGALQTATIGYWIDQAFAGNDYIAESVVVAAHYAFEHLRLHRLEICIIPRNYNSHRVMEKIGIRAEGTALRFLEINGVWEDHVRYGLTAEEWNSRRADLVTTWLGSH